MSNIQVKERYKYIKKVILSSIILIVWFLILFIIFIIWYDLLNGVFSGLIIAFIDVFNKTPISIKILIGISALIITL